jgi:hypothetical protein
VVESAARPPPENANAGISVFCIDLAGRPGLRLRVAFAAGAPPDQMEFAPGLRPVRDWLA